MTVYYCVMQVDDRCQENVKNTRQLMDSANFTFIDREYFSWRKRDPRKYLSQQGVSISKWQEFSHLGLPPLEGELGYLSSFIDILNDLKVREVERAVVIEDDCIIDESFVDNAKKAIDDYDFDIFYLSYGLNQWEVENNEEYIIDDFAVRANFKTGCSTAYVISKQGIRKILKTLKRMGAVGATDLTLDEYGRRGFFNALCVNPSTVDPAGLVADARSVVDPDNIRHSV